MITGYVATEIRRSTRHLLILNLILAAIVLGIPLIAAPYISECLRGPFPMTVEELARIPGRDQAPHRFIRITIDPDMLDETGYKITGGQANKNDFYHFLHVSGTQVLIILNGAQNLPENGVLEGSIENLSLDATDTVIPAVRGDVKFTSAGNVMFDTASYRSGLYIMLGVCFPILALALWNILKSFRRFGDPTRHPIAKRLAAFGPVDEMAIALDAEMQAGADRVGKVITTQSWLLRPYYTGLHIVYLGDVVWAYKKETKIKSYGITTGHTYATVIHDKHGKRLEFQLNQKQVDALVAELAQRVPWAYVGFSPQLSIAWTKQRPQMLAAVEQRKSQILNAPATPAPPTAPSS